MIEDARQNFRTSEFGLDKVDLEKTDLEIVLAGLAHTSATDERLFNLVSNLMQYAVASPIRERVGSGQQ